MKILFVCTGNTCRSPMAEALVRKKMPEAEVRSAGIFAGNDGKANPKAIASLKDHNIDLDHHSHPATHKLLNWADLVLTMTTGHKQSLILQHPNFQDKYFTLKEYVSETDKKIWNELKQAYATYEEKRSNYIQENHLKLDNSQLDAKLSDSLKDDLQKIQQLEANLINYDVSDPFGGSLKDYQETLAELDRHIERLIKKLK